MQTHAFTMAMVLFMLFSVILLSGCKDSDDVRIQKKLENAIRVSNDKPTHILQTLDTIQSCKTLTKKNFMLLQIAQLRATRNANLSISEKQAARMTKAVKYFESLKENKRYKAWANLYAGVAYYKINNLEKGFRYYLKAYLYARANNDSLIVGKILYNLGNIYYTQQMYDSAYVYYRRALPCVNSSIELKVQLYRSLSLVSLRQKNYIRSLEYLNTGAPLLVLPQNRLYQHRYNTQYGNLYKALGEYDKSIYWYRKNLTEDLSYQEELRTAVNLTHVYTLTHNNDLATHYKTEVESILCDTTKKIVDNHLVALSFKVLRDYYIQQNNTEETIDYTILYISKNDEIRENNISQKLLSIHQEIVLKIADAKNKEGNVRLLSYTILFTIFFFIIILAIINIKLKNKLKREVELKNAEISILQYEVDRMKRR